MFSFALSESVKYAHGWSDQKVNEPGITGIIFPEKKRDYPGAAPRADHDKFPVHTGFTIKFF